MIQPLFPLWQNGWLDASGYHSVRKVRLSLGDIVLDGDPTPPKRGTSPTLRTMSIVAKRLDG